MTCDYTELVPHPSSRIEILIVCSVYNDETEKMSDCYEQTSFRFFIPCDSTVISFSVLKQMHM
jgi:hypothetical protein